jgi:hypothetical protein
VHLPQRVPYLNANVLLHTPGRTRNRHLPAQQVLYDAGHFADLSHDGKRWRFSHRSKRRGPDGSRVSWLVYEELAGERAE